jgi:integrase
VAGTTNNGKTRRVGFGDRVLRLLADLKAGATDKSGYVFTPPMAGLKDSSYAFLDPDYFDASIYRPIPDAAGLKNIRFHDLRHFFASMLIAQGESAKYVCDQMGHSSIQVTFDTSGHLFPQPRQEASQKLERAMLDKRRGGGVEKPVEIDPPHHAETRESKIKN